MAEVQDPSQSVEPSMEEILASIRKIISDDAPASGEAEGMDVIELTQMVDDSSGAIVDVTPPEPAPAPAPVTSQETLVSEPAATAAVSALSSLANTIEIERLATAPLTGTALGNGSRTLEDMVIELMRPLLRQWLDQNLPATVDRLVQKEIERISRRAQD